jgi:hypothetical protein
MKATIPYCFVSLIAWTSGMIVFCATNRVQAADLYWNLSGTGGSGIWGTSPGEKNWNTVPGAPAGNITWPDTINSVAIFQDLSGGVVTLSDPLQTAGITQNGANYSINAGVITLVQNSAATNPFIHVQGGILTIDSVLTGSNGLIKTGAGNLTLTGSNSLSGNTQIENGILTLSGTLASNTVGITSGASVLNQNGGLSNGATLTNAGSLTLNVNDTVTSYISNGGNLTAGAGTLFTTSAALNAGSTLAGLLNTSSLTSDGAVILSGTATAGSAVIQIGALTLSGTLASNTIGITSSASVLNQNGGLSGGATLTNAGSLTLNVNDTVTNYISNGGNLTAGAGTLFTTSATLSAGSTLAGLLNSSTLTSDGAVLLSGTATAGSAMIQSGVLTLSGTLASNAVGITSSASVLNQNGGLSNGATLTNAGSLTLNVNDTVTTYVSNGGTLTTGAGTLFTTSAALNAGSTLAGLLNTSTLTSDGAVLLSGTATAGSAMIQSGVLTLSGTLASNAVGITSSASVLNQNGGLSNGATLTNAGSLTLNVNDTVTTYVSNGGTLTAGAGTLFTTSAALNSGTTLAGLLNTNTLTSDGATQVSGTIAANSINITTGTLTNTGRLGIGSTLININQGATLNAGGIQQYSLLTTSGTGAGTWLGNLANTRNIAPGGLNSIGVLAIGGNFNQSDGGTLTMDFSAMNNDRLDIIGDATFNGSLVLNQLGATPIVPFVPITIISASDYSGNFTSLSENITGAVWFNPGNGSVMRIDSTSVGNSFTGSTRNQTSTWIALYDDAIDPGTTNITSSASGYQITSGIADIGNPDLLWALAASFTPNGLNAALLNRLSPEVYGGLSDYAIQATRVHQRSALSAPALYPRNDSKSGIASSGKDGAKGGIVDLPVPLDWEFFAALDYLQSGTDNSLNQADYDFEGMGVLSGARTRPTEKTQLGVYFGVDSGTLSGELIDADVFGWNTGLLGEYLLNEKTRTRLTAGMSYGSYAYDGSRGSASATAAGWSPAKVDFDDVGVDAFDLSVGMDGVAWKQNALAVIPAIGLRYAMSTMESFNESNGGTPGSPIALDVSRDRHESLLLEIGLQAQMNVNAKLVLWGESGANFGLLDEGRVLAASFARGSREMSTEANGLNDDSLFLGCGAAYQISDDIRASLVYRVDIRTEARAQQELRLSSSWRF